MCCKWQLPYAMAKRSNTRICRRKSSTVRRLPVPSRVPAAAPAPHLADDADTSTLNAIQIKERETVLQLLDEHRWNVSNVAKVLGISRNTL